MINPNFVIFGAVISLYGSIVYVISTIKGKTTPNRVTWFLWALAPLIAFSAQISQGVGIQSLITFMAGFGPLMIFISSFVNSKSVWKLTKFDFTCGGLSVLGLILWAITKDGNLAIALAIAADFIAALPTIVKSFKAADTENYQAFLFSGIGAGLTLLTIDIWSFEYWAFPLYIFLVCLLLFVLIKFDIGSKLSRSDSDILPV